MTSTQNKPSQDQQSLGNGGGPLFVMQSMQSPSERYLSTESLENDRTSTTSSTESPGGIHHRKDHEFIPTRTQTISASKPAADPNRFTKVPSNPLLISAQKQIMQAEEIRKKKEQRVQVVKRGDDEPDWQSNLSSWKNRRRKQSEEALQRVAEVKALEDSENTGEPRKISIGKKLSTLLYTSGEDLDWSEMGLDKDEDEDDRPQNQNDNGGHNQRFPSPAKIPEEKKPEQPKEWSSSGVQNWTQVIRQDAPKRAVSSPVVTYTQRINNNDNEANQQQQQHQQPQVRRKSSELSSTMKSRLEAFNSQEALSSGSNSMESEVKQLTAGPIEPDQQFHKKLMAFRKISEGKLEQPQDMKPKPPISISSLLGGQQQQHRVFESQEESSRSHQNDDFETNTLDDVDQLLDEALEESYQSVLEEQMPSDVADSKDNDGVVFSDHDFANKKTKVPPMEKPPPPPSSGGCPEDVSDDIDQQERAIIASLEMEEREHNKYIQEKMKRLPTPSSSSTSNTCDSGISSSSKPTSVKDSEKPNQCRSESAPNRKASSSQSYTLAENNLINQYGHPQQQQPQQFAPKQRRHPDQQRTYNQHWLVQEAEQRRIAEMNSQQQTYSNVKQPSPNAHGNQAPGIITSPVYENSSYANQPHHRQQSKMIPSASTLPSHHHPNMVHSSHPVHNENVYANLGSQPSVGSMGNYVRDGRIPGPQVPPRNPSGEPQQGSTGERVLSVSGKKRCSHCKEELGRGAAMIIESLRLYYHLKCFQCCVCHIQLGNGATGTDVRVRNNKLHCQNCYSNDEGLKFSKV